MWVVVWGVGVWVVVWGVRGVGIDQSVFGVWVVM